MSCDLSADLEKLVLSLSDVTQETKAFLFSKLEANKAIHQHVDGLERVNDDAKNESTVGDTKCEEESTNGHKNYSNCQIEARR